MAAAVEPKPRLVLLVNPNSPTGTVVADDSTEEFTGSLAANCLFGPDEAYCDFGEEGIGPRSLARREAPPLRAASAGRELPASRWGWP
jgi:histidinol-phosphate/aromatic aminotransferase/cobyric acid decarboxylase-like protein